MPFLSSSFFISGTESTLPARQAHFQCYHVSHFDFALVSLLRKCNHHARGLVAQRERVVADDVSISEVVVVVQVGAAEGRGAD